MAVRDWIDPHSLEYSATDTQETVTSSTDSNEAIIWPVYRPTFKEFYRLSRNYAWAIKLVSRQNT